LIIRSIADLERALTNQRIVGLFAHEPLSVQLIQLGERERAKWQDRLNARVRDCGCGVGAIFAMLSGLIVFIFSLIGRSVSLGLLTRSAGEALLSAFILGLAGKFLGLWIAKARLKRDCRQLLRAIESQCRLEPLIQGRIIHVNMHKVGRPRDDRM